MKGYLRREKINVQVLDTREEEEHFHQDIEMIYLLEGTMDISIGEKDSKFNAGDILVINSNKKHLFRAKADSLFVKVLISYELVGDIFRSGDIIFWCDSTKDDNDALKELRNVLNELLENYLNTKGSTANFAHIAMCYRVLDLLSSNFLVRNSDKETGTEKEKFKDRIWQIENYISSNYSQAISLKDLAEKLFLSNGYLSRFFKNHYGMSFAEYLSNVRLYHAVDELLYTDTPITRIVYDNGFANVAVFNKTMKKVYHETPSALRKKKKSKDGGQRIKDAAMESSEKSIETKLEKFFKNQKSNKADRRQGQDKKERISVECNVQEHCLLKHGWLESINGGSAMDMLRYEVREHIVLLKGIMHFQYVRFWNIFSEQMLIDIHQKNDEYNFSRLDAILDFLVQSNLKPHIELGQKPRRIRKSVQNYLLEEKIEDFFVTIDEWKNLLNALIRHLIRRYGSKEVDSWRLEIWYDERYKKIPTIMGDYFAVFNAACQTIRRYSSEIEIGGCGIRVDFNSELGLEFLEEWSRQPYTPDYLSMLYFAYDRRKENENYYTKRSTDESGLLHKIRKLRHNMDLAGFGNKKLYVTEWNMSISERNYLNDTCFKGAYLVKNLLETYAEADSFGYFQATDRIFEYYDSNEILYGGNGILSKDTILKPVGFSFDFLGRLCPYLIQKTSDYIVTTDGHDTYGIICHNEKPLNYNYYLMDEDKVKKEHIARLFKDHDDRSFEIILREMMNGQYQIKIYRVNNQNASILNIWEELGYDKDLSKSDIKYFRRVCEPKLMIQKAKVSEQCMKMKINLQENEVVFIRIRKLD